MIGSPEIATDGLGAVKSASSQHRATASESSLTKARFLFLPARQNLNEVQWAFSFSWIDDEGKSELGEATTEGGLHTLVCQGGRDVR